MRVLEDTLLPCSDRKNGPSRILERPARRDGIVHVCPQHTWTVLHTSPSTPTNGLGTGKAGAMRPIGSPKINADGRDEDESAGSGFGNQMRWRGPSASLSPPSSLRPSGLGSGNEGQEPVWSRREDAKADQSNGLRRELSVDVEVDADELDAEEGGASWGSG
jgi:hypothetical protein